MRGGFVVVNEGGFIGGKSCLFSPFLARLVELHDADEFEEISPFSSEIRICNEMERNEFMRFKKQKKGIKSMRAR